MRIRMGYVHPTKNGKFQARLRILDPDAEPDRQGCQVTYLTREVADQVAQRWEKNGELPEKRLTAKKVLQMRKWEAEGWHQLSVVPR